MFIEMYFYVFVCPSTGMNENMFMIYIALVSVSACPLPCFIISSKGPYAFPSHVSSTTENQV